MSATATEIEDGARARKGPIARFFGIVTALLFWPLPFAITLAILPFIWVYILIRSVYVYAGMMLVHAIASRDLHIGISDLEKSITWYSQRLKSAFVLLRLLLSSKRQYTEQPSDLDDEDFDDFFAVPEGTPLGESMSIFLRRIRRWALTRLLPSLIIWILIYLGLKARGLDLAFLVQGEDRYIKIALWMAAWFAAGSLGILITPVIRAVLVTPFVVLIGLLWLPLGFVFWIPRIFMSMIIASALSFSFVMTGGRTRNPNIIFTRAFEYYLSGFSIIGNVLTNPGHRTEMSKEERQSAIKSLMKSLGFSFLYLLAWPVVLFLLAWAGWLRPILASICTAMPDQWCASGAGPGVASLVNQWSNELHDATVVVGT